MTDSIYNERVCPTCKGWIWKWDKECSKCHPKKKKKQVKNDRFLTGIDRHREMVKNTDDMIRGGG